MLEVWGVGVGGGWGVGVGVKLTSNSGTKFCCHFFPSFASLMLGQRSWKVFHKKSLLNTTSETFNLQIPGHFLHSQFCVVFIKNKKQQQQRLKREFLNI